ncbi:hypothetical protein [Vibrio splendidus]|uniref:hypothetical protein n=1 Tax=Vibrio splendidus TaxID=29497 RepID=UPI003D0E5FC5
MATSITATGMTIALHRWHSGCGWWTFSLERTNVLRPIGIAAGRVTASFCWRE